MFSPQEKVFDFSSLTVPNHVAIIMDGNGRWARQRGLPRQAGHRAGAENLRRIVRACVEFDVKILTIYAFSTENWGRPESEVRGLMRIFARVLDQELDELRFEGGIINSNSWALAAAVREIGAEPLEKPSLAKGM